MGMPKLACIWALSNEGNWKRFVAGNRSERRSSVGHAFCCERMKIIRVAGDLTGRLPKWLAFPSDRSFASASNLFAKENKYWLASRDRPLPVSWTAKPRRRWSRFAAVGRRWGGSDGRSSCCVMSWGGLS